MKKIVVILAITGIIMGVIFPAAAEYTMSWDFQMFNNPNARQVALNVAKEQAGLIKEEEDPIDRFREGLERRLYSSAQRNIIDMILDEDKLPYGEYETGDLIITVAEDPQTGEVIIDITNVVTGDSTTVRYSLDKWPTNYNY